MAYDLSWGSDHPGLIVWLLDLSHSMKNPINTDSPERRIDELQKVLFDVTNRLIQDNRSRTLAKKSSFDIKVYAYNSGMIGDGPIFEGNLLSLKQARDKALLNGTQLFDLPEPNYQTFTAEAFEYVAKEIQKWIDSQPKGRHVPAPMVVHITDGIPVHKQDNPTSYFAETVRAAENLKSISTPDGNTILFNIQIRGELGKSSFLASAPDRPEMRVLWDASSVMDEDYASRARNALRPLEKEGFNVDGIQAGSRMLVTNEDKRNILAQLLVFGSSPIAEVEPEKPE